MSRLSYNTWRRGLFNLHDEDYRWEILRRKLHPVLFQITNLTFIAIIQNILLFLLGVPTYIAAAQPHVALTTSDYVLGTLALLTVLTEFVADNQQYSFQTFKHSKERKVNENEWPGARIRWTQEDAERGFVTKGLWGWSRHPNFLCEQTFWVRSWTRIDSQERLANSLQNGRS
jgi:steroid 5-alpha reductase family enzyme